MLNREDNTFTKDWMAEVNHYLDIVDKIPDEEATVLVTLGAGEKRFSTGFDLKWWAEDYPANAHSSIPELQLLLARFLGLRVPTMAVMRGHVYAGGLLMALAHDIRLMSANRGKVCLSAIKMGIAPPSGLNHLCKSTLPIQTFREIQYGKAYTPQEAMNMSLITDTFTDHAELHSKLQQFSMDFGPASLHKDAIATNKQLMFKDTLTALRTECYSPSMLSQMSRAKNLVQTLARK